LWGVAGGGRAGGGGGPWGGGPLGDGRRGGGRTAPRRELPPGAEQAPQELDRLRGRAGVLGGVARDQASEDEGVEGVELSGDRAGGQVEDLAQSGDDLLAANRRVVGRLDVATLQRREMDRREPDRTLVE